MRLFLGLLLLPVFCQAQDVALLAGQMKLVDQPGQSFGASLDATYHWGALGAISAAYLNEGHPDGHHRDGLASQLWLHTPIPQQGVSLGLGYGPYYYFDTSYGSGNGLDYRNDHGWGSLLSLSAKWHLEKRSYVELRASRIRAHHDHDSTLILVGLGYELQNLPASTEQRNAEAGKDVLTYMAGQAIVNSFQSERAHATSLEYRRIINPNMEVSAAWLADGIFGSGGRRGISSQVWLIKPLTEHFVLEMGGGLYAMDDGLDRANLPNESRGHIVPLASVGVRYRISRGWRAQLTWTRVITDYHRDSDVLLTGIGFAF
ncbi:MAG: hypothetical protein V4508_02780 [Pseudomonadota bacterium]